MLLKMEKKKPEVCVIVGGGNGIPIYQRLQREQRPLAAGILWENDVEYADAQALAAQVIAEKAFYPIGEQRLEQAKKILDQCEDCLLYTSLRQQVMILWMLQRKIRLRLYSWDTELLIPQR